MSVCRSVRCGKLKLAAEVRRNLLFFLYEPVEQSYDRDTGRSSSGLAFRHSDNSQKHFLPFS